MSFKPQPNQLYYLIPKGKTNHVIGAPNASLGVHLNNQLYQSDNEHQRFQFDPAGEKNWWLLLPPFKEHYIAIHDSSGNEKAPAIQWQWEPAKHNLRFQFLPAGNGYYRIMALHSHKFLEIVDLSATEKGQLVQCSYNKNDGQLFSLTPVPNVPSNIPPIAFSQKSGIERTATLTILGKIPEVGAGLSFVVGLFWKADDPLADLWKQMKTYVDVRIRTLLMENKLNDMSMEIKGILKSVAEISRDDKPKGARITGKVDSIVDIEEKYMAVAKTALPYLVALGNVQLSLRRTLYTDYDTLFPPGKSEPGDGPKLLRSKQQNLTELKTAIAEYKTTFDEAITTLVTNRMAKIHWEEITGRRTATSSFYIKGGRVSDDFDGWSLTFWYDEYIKNARFKNYKEWAEFAYNQRKLQIQAQYATEMRDLGKAALLWEYFDQITPLPAPVTYRVKVGAFGGLNHFNPFNGVDNSTITAIEVYSLNGDLCGLQVFYNGTGNGLQGKAGNKTDRLNLDKGTNGEEDEFITSVYGHYLDHIYGLWFVTSHGKIVGAGKEYHAYFCADIADGLKGRLEKISGFNDVHTLEQLNFHWKYSEIPPKTPTV
ncbi:RICIN domain-containing protein [Mucilaginibacter sp. L196]|uniref:RICIN domain-containing protein n=1 Tax=Mucilaginibacter sp. L196 TaxID=1641870 RepID=UPI00131CF280|nr:RICIN domain-containing protein [Mucilaginibacter sp. L196]